MKVWLVWATNVGKSTLFNRLIGTYRAIVTNIAGTTRELLRDFSQWDQLKGVEFIDSPGLLDFTEEMHFIKKIVDESDVFLFVVDAKVGVGPKEQQIADMLIRTWKKKNTILVVNKLEGHLIPKKYAMALADYYELGFEHVIGVSAKAGENIDMLLELIEEYKAKIVEPIIERDPSIIALAIVGKPNAGKSTLMNYLAKEVVAHVSAKPWTTLDYLTTDMKLGKHMFRLYDTAGMRKNAKASWLERIAWDKTYKMIDFVKPIVIVMIDMADNFTHMDLKIIGEMIEHKVPIVVAMSKIDLIKNPKEKKQKMDMVDAYMKMARWIPIVVISGQTGEGIQALFAAIKKISEQQFRRISTGEINKMIGQAMIKSPPRFPKNKICKIYYMTQVDVNPPTFCCFINKLDRQNFAFSKWLDNSLRKAFGFAWVPLVLTFKEKWEGAWGGGYTSDDERGDYTQEYEDSDYEDTMED